jgi:pSer/pThr/pTyr-binding forkhead associated (FHA) protein
VQAAPSEDAGPDPDQTYFYASPKRPAAFQVVQVLRGGMDGIVLNARENVVEIGREGVDLNFPEDVYMSGCHARVELSPSGVLQLSDRGSKNGTYVRIQDAQALHHGDYLFLGKQLLRVEKTLA